MARIKMQPITLGTEDEGVTRPKMTPAGEEPESALTSPLPPGTGVTRTPPLGFAESPGGAATGIRMPRVATRTTEEVPPWLARVGLETALSSLGGTALGGATGLVTKNPYLTGLAMRGGETGGAFLGSLLSETFDPTESPLKTAGAAAMWTAGTGAVATGGTALLRRAIGQPTEAGKYILQVMEKEGKVPPPGAVLPPTSIAQTLQAIGSAEAFFGKNVGELVKETGMSVTRDLRHYVADFYRYKKGARIQFKAWDDAVKQAFGNSRAGGARIPSDVFDTLESALKEWDRLGLTSTLDNNLREGVRYAMNLRAEAAKQGMRLPTINLSISEAEAARSFLYQLAKDSAGKASTEAKAVAGETFAKGFRTRAEEVGQAMDEAIDRAVKQGKISPDARANVLAGRQLWKQWKQGETMLDELAIPLRAASREREALSAQMIDTAIKNIERFEDKIGHPVVSTTQKAHLAGIMRALRAVEDSGKSGAFTLAVRTGQLATLTMGVSAGAKMGGAPGVFGSVVAALSPGAFTFLVTNPQAVKLLITGLRAEPGTAVALRTGRELLTLLAKEGHTDLDRLPPPTEPASE